MPETQNPVIHALTRKIPPKRGLPAFVWLIAITIGIVIYRHRHPGTSLTGTSAANVADTSGTDTTAPFYGMGSGSSDLGGGGGGGDQSGLTQPASAPVSWDPGQFAALVASDLSPLITPANDQVPGNDPQQTPVGATDGNTGTGRGTAHESQPLSPATNPESAYQAGGPGGSHLVQPLKWGGQTFYTQSDFAAWVRKHGSSVKTELAQHPEAAKIYHQLGTTPYAAATVPSPAAQKAAGKANVSRAPVSAPAKVTPPAPKVSAPITRTPTVAARAPVVKRTSIRVD